MEPIRTTATGASSTRGTGPETGVMPVVARNLVKAYGDFIAVRGIDFTVRPGECFGFLGPNGAGKTSTMRMISCTSPVTSGELLVNGLPVQREPRTIKTGIGVVPQEDNLDEELSVNPQGNRLLLHTCRGETVGRVHPRLAQRILSLMDVGNRYEAAFLRDHPAEGVQVIIGEVCRHPSQQGRPSYPPSEASGFRGYVRNNHELLDRGLGAPPARDTSDDEDDPPEFEVLVRARSGRTERTSGDAYGRSGRTLARHPGPHSPPADPFPLDGGSLGWG